MEIDRRLRLAIQSYWNGRAANRTKQDLTGRRDAGARGEVTGGQQMAALERLVADILRDAGIPRADIRARAHLELPGYFRSTKKWDLVVVSNSQLVMAMEFKSQAGKSIGNNVNNRAEEAVGSAKDIWTAYREGRFGSAPAPLLGYFFLLEDQPEVRTAVKSKEPHFPVDPVFVENGQGVSYAQRYEILCRRLVMERLYSTACFVLATNAERTRITEPADDLTFRRFVAALRGHVL
ncbi:MAG: restriction endonuclease [Acidobacteria bacterium]|nr:restriction endonuclease [Acidobacteriota bacterium]